jgi:hypothetical protein
VQCNLLLWFATTKRYNRVFEDHFIVGFRAISTWVMYGNGSLVLVGRSVLVASGVFIVATNKSSVEMGPTLYFGELDGWLGRASRTLHQRCMH